MKPWDVAGAADIVQGGTLGSRIALLSSASVPLATDGSYVLGAIVMDVLVHEVIGSELGDTAFFGRVGRFVFDSSTAELLTLTPRSDGRAVILSYTTGCTDDMEWTVSVFGRPAGGGRRVEANADAGSPPSRTADDGQLPTLVSRVSSLMQRTEPYDAALRAIAEAAVAAGGAADPVRHFRDLSLVTSTFGVAGPPVAGRDAAAGGDGGTCPLTVLSVEPSSRSAIHRLSTLALSCLSVQPARLRVARPPATEDDSRGAAAPVRRRRLLPLAPAPEPVRGPLLAAGGAGAPAGVAPLVAADQPDWVAVAATAVGAGVTAGATAATYAGGGGAGTPAPPPTGGRRRRPVDLAAITDPVVRARVMRNRAAARASNERRRAARAAAASSPPPPPPALDTQPSLGDHGAASL